ncbi:hypothetical protein FACS189426_22830 [Bacteroidia bacterium]|nr:hypothetical protein FACS189426_22830 [Bacteroidia bacterium]
MTKKYIYFFLVYLFFCGNLYSQESQDKKLYTDTIPGKEYSFILQDSPSSLFTMRQSNENFLSLYRLGVREIDKSFSPKVSSITQILLQAFFFMPLTHEEGHRSILTNAGIGSISKPYFNKDLAAYVTGVTDQSLIDLRKNNLPVFTRMYIGGVESDYALLLRENSLMNFRDESRRILWTEYVLRKLNVISYYAMGLFKYEIGIEEEKNELERDIAGMDVYGAIRALHNPTMEFKRYVNYADLQPEERKFVKRVGWRSFINLIDPTLIFDKGFNIKDQLQINFNLGYSMAPFGDFIDEHFWLKTKSLRTHFYFRQYQNKDNWFPAFGVDFQNMKFAKNLYTSAAFHAWSQPKDLLFYQKDSKTGGAIDVLFKYRFPVRNISSLSGISINLGVIAKTQGFLLEEVEMDKKIGIRLGTSFWLK